MKDFSAVAEVIVMVRIFSTIIPSSVHPKKTTLASDTQKKSFDQISSLAL